MLNVPATRPTGSGGSGFIARIPTDHTLPRWRTWVAAHPIGSSLLAGVVATQFATVFGIWFKGFGLPVLNWPTVNGSSSSRARRSARSTSRGSFRTSPTVSSSRCCSPCYSTRWCRCATHCSETSLRHCSTAPSSRSSAPHGGCRPCTSRTMRVSSAPASAGNLRLASSCGTGSTVTSSAPSTARCRRARARQTTADRFSGRHDLPGQAGIRRQPAAPGCELR